MIYTTVAATLLGLSALVSAAPRPSTELSPAERGLTWEPRSVKQLQKKGSFIEDNSFNRDFFSEEQVNIEIEIVDTVIVSNDDNDSRDSRNSREDEEVFAVLVEAQIDIRDGYNRELRNHRDNIRRNHYNNHYNGDFIELIIITVIIDARDESNHRTRYATRGLDINSRRNSRAQTLEVLEVVAITIDSSFSSSFYENYRPTGTISAGNSIQTVSPNAPYLQNNQTQILPDGISYPRFGDIQTDPASISEVDQVDIFVEVIVESDSNSNSGFGNSFSH